MPNLLSGRQPVKPSAQLSTNRYKYVSLAEAQPSLGTPSVDNSILLGNVNGTTSWLPQSAIVSTTLPTQNVIFVSKNGNDSNSGSSIGAPKQSISSALSLATAGTTIVVFSGTYTENNPLKIPDNVSVIGQDNNVVVIPQITTGGVFYLNSGSTIVGITVKNHKAPAYAFNIDSNAIINEAPLIKDCSSITGPFLNDGTLFIPYTTVQNVGIPPGATPLSDTQVSDVTKRVNTSGAGGGVYVNGSVFSQLSLLKYVNIENFTAINQGGVGILAENGVTVQSTSTVTKLCSKSIYALNGAVINLNSCTTEYGNKGLVSENYNTSPYISNGIISESFFSSISGISISEQGSGYSTEPTITFGKIWEAGITVALHSQYYYGNNLYIVTTAGTFGITPPTHNADSGTNGTVTLLYTGSVAQATAQLTDGKLTNIIFSNYGNGYTEIPSVNISGTSTTSAHASASLSGIQEFSVGSLTEQPIKSTLIGISGITSKYIITSATPINGTVTYIKTNPNLLYVLQGSSASFYYDSIINSNGHTFMFAGSGVTYNALPDNGGVPNPNLEVDEINYGQVYYSSLNERGLYKIGDVFSVDLITNTSTLNASQFNLSNIGAIGPIIRDGVPSGVQLQEISNNTNLISSNGFIDQFTVPTQYAISTYLENNYLKLTGGGTVTGVININDLMFNSNVISSRNLNQNIVISPIGTGSIDASTSKIINVVDPTSGQDVATKAYVDSVLGGTQTYPTFNIGDFLIQQDTILNVIDDGNMLLSTTGTGYVKITNDIDSTSSTTGALVVSGGVGIAKNVYVGIAVHAPKFYGDLTGTAEQSLIVTNNAQPNITSVGTLTDLQVDQVYINGSTIKNSQINTDLKLGITGAANVIPETPNAIGFGSINNQWFSGYFTSIYGTIQTADQPNITSLSPNVNLYDNSYTLTPSLSIGYDSTNRLVISSEHTNSNLTNTKFTTYTTGTNSGAMQFYPDENLAMTVDNGLISTTNLYTDGLLSVKNPIIKLGPVDKTTSINHNTGIEYISNINITSNVSSVVITSNGSTNTSVVTLNVTVDTLNIDTNDYIYLEGSFTPSTLQNYWAISSVVSGSHTFELNIPVILPADTYTLTPTKVLLSKKGFFGYDQSSDAFTVITNASITDNVVTGDVGTISANLTSNNVSLNGGSINNVVIGGTTPVDATFSMVSSNKYHTTITIESTGGDDIVVDSFPANSIDIAKYIIKMKDVDSGAITGQDLLLVHDGVNTYISEYGVAYTSDTLLGTFSATIDNGIVNLILTPDVLDNNLNISITLFRFYG